MLRRFGLSLCVLSCIAFAVPPAAAQTEFPTGVEWQASSEAVKRAYLLGIANLMSAARGVDRRVRQTAVGRLYNATRNTTVEEAVAKVDEWYAKNPTHKSQEVIDVLWLIYVGR